MNKSLLQPLVLIGALGYFVDIYDLVLFGTLRVASLKAIGVADSEMLKAGTNLLNLQMIGMLLGGVLWGFLGDRRGRTTVLLGSILLYSLANIANAFAGVLPFDALPFYAVCRFAAGVGLAGEMGAAVTLVSEGVATKSRGIGSAIIGLAGFAGALTASSLGGVLPWRYSYFVGGVMGLILLAARMRLSESQLFCDLKSTKVSFAVLLKSRKLIGRLVTAILVGVPVWFTAGVLIFFSPEFAKVMNITGPVAAGQAIFWSYLGSMAGDIASGLISQLLQSRRKTIAGFLFCAALGVVAYFFLSPNRTPAEFYAICFFLGVGNGYWALFVTMLSEQFGTNVRATVTVLGPNLVRSATVPLVFMFQSLSPRIGEITGAVALGLTTLTVALVALFALPETFSREMNFLD